MVRHAFFSCLSICWLTMLSWWIGQLLRSAMDQPTQSRRLGPCTLEGGNICGPGATNDVLKDGWIYLPHMEKQRSCWWKSQSGFRQIGVEMEKLCAANLTGWLMSDGGYNKLFKEKRNSILVGKTTTTKSVSVGCERCFRTVRMVGLTASSLEFHPSKFSNGWCQGWM